MMINNYYDWLYNSNQMIIPQLISIYSSELVSLVLFLTNILEMIFNLANDELDSW